MQRATARLWREGGQWVIQVELDGVPYTERAYDDVASATQALAQILRLRAERPDVDEDLCDECDLDLNHMTCSQCGTNAFVRTCDHGGARPIRVVDTAAFCRACRP